MNPPHRWSAPLLLLLLLLLLAPGCAGPAAREEDAFREQAQVLREALVTLEGAAAPVVFQQGELPEGIGFRIAVRGDDVRVRAADPAGAALAAATLVREARWEQGRWRWPEGTLEDGPGCSFRAFMVDMGRVPHPPALLRQVVDMLWFHRANVLHLHLSDDQLFSWPSRAFPRLQSATAGWTRQDFVELEAYARARGVLIVPELDVPGHSTILRREYPEVFGTTPTELASLPGARAGLEILLGELLEVFRSTPWVHVGGDEAYGVPEQDQRDLINHLAGWLRERGRRAVVWEGPRLGRGAEAVDRDVLHMAWRTVNVPAQAYLDAGYQVVNAAWDPLYVVDHYPRTMVTAVDVARCFAWEPTRFGHVDPGMAPFAAPHRARPDEDLLGFCMPWWEGRPEWLLPLCLPRFAAVAEAAWDLERPGGYPAFTARMERLRPRLLRLAGMALPPVPRADPASQVGNLAFGRPVQVSAGADQPPFGPERLTNGLTDFLDHFLGYPCAPEPLRITIDLGAVQPVSRVVVHETSRGDSHERYRLLLSEDGQEWVEVGASGPGRRGERSFVEHAFMPRPARHVRLVTEGCHGLTFPSFSRLCEVQVFGEG